MIKIFIYYFIWIIVFVFSLLEILNYKINKNILRILIFLLIIITGFRYFNGVDYETYSIIFRNIKNTNDYSYMEFLFRLIVVFNNKILDYNYSFIIFSVLNFIFLYFALKKIEYPLLGLFIYINLFWINYSFNGMRQGIAMNCFLLGVLSLSSSYLILCIISTLIHKVSLAIFFSSKVILMIKKKIKYQNYIIIFFSIIFLVFSKIIIRKLSIIVPKLAYFSVNFNSFSIKGLIFRVITVIIFIYFESRNYKDIFYRKIFNVYIFRFLEYLLLFDSYMFGTRINMFFRILEIILYSRIFYNLKNKTNKIILFFILSIFWGSIYGKDILSSWNSPYRVNPYFYERNN